MPVGMEMAGNQNAEPFGMLLFELPTKTGTPKVADGTATTHRVVAQTNVNVNSM